MLSIRLRNFFSLIWANRTNIDTVFHQLSLMCFLYSLILPPLIESYSIEYNIQLSFIYRPNNIISYNIRSVNPFIQYFLYSFNYTSILDKVYCLIYNPAYIENWRNTMEDLHIELEKYLYFCENQKQLSK